MLCVQRILTGSIGAVVLILALSVSLAAQNATSSTATTPTPTATPAKISYDAEYTLGPGDQIRIWALGAEEISGDPRRIDPTGNLDLPLVGRMRASGLSVDELRAELVNKLKADIREPIVSVEILEYGSQPVSIIGAVGEPGIHQLQGRRTLAEVLSLAGGTRPDAGSRIKVTRQLEWGAIPVEGSQLDPSGKFYVAEVNLKDFLSASKPENNIQIFPHDVITVPQSELVYVVGAVNRAGGFPLNERESVTALQAVAIAEGLGPLNAAQDAKILRAMPSGERREIEVDLKKILAGKTTDVALQPNDILFVPNSTSKAVAARVLETTLATISGIAIWRGF
jgi:polysaccharide export outer membrane protein